MKYDDIGYLENWKTKGQYPVIHDPIFRAIQEHCKGKRFVDLGCCYGLLGQRIITQIPNTSAIGVEANSRLIQAAQKAGIAMQIYHMRITPDHPTFGTVQEILRDHGQTVLVARRIFPELFGDLPAPRATFTMFLYFLERAGITEIFVQGRQKSARATNYFSSIEKESETISRVYPLRWTRGEVAYHAL